MNRIFLFFLLTLSAPLYAVDVDACCKLVEIEMEINALKATKGITEVAMKTAELSLKVAAEAEGKLKLLQGSEIAIRESVNFVAKGAGEVGKFLNIKSIEGSITGNDIAQGKLPKMTVDTGAFGTLSVQFDFTKPFEIPQKLAEKLTDLLMEKFSK